MAAASLPFMYVPPISASVADDTTLGIFLQRTWIAPLCGGLVSSVGVLLLR